MKKLVLAVIAFIGLLVPQAAWGGVYADCFVNLSGLGAGSDYYWSSHNAGQPQGICSYAYGANFAQARDIALSKFPYGTKMSSPSLQVKNRPIQCIVNAHLRADTRNVQFHKCSR